MDVACSQQLITRAHAIFTITVIQWYSSFWQLPYISLDCISLSLSQGDDAIITHWQFTAETHRRVLWKRTHSPATWNEYKATTYMAREWSHFPCACVRLKLSVSMYDCDGLLLLDNPPKNTLIYASVGELLLDSRTEHLYYTDPHLLVTSRAMHN